ncbi:peroxisome biogenesis protein 1 isoform X2 [Punica granatum]|uniref:Peroxisomal ATPase PEX1 n=1 Tax=Punica granatum TaxID=22663 RepID=A0A6P8CZD9_PUNGR|nr:peroxisome biogenesis protein 1 isoform X2 [Punica granatum]
MEFEVRAVGGIEDCFVSLPLTLIQTLQQSTPSGILPHLLTLELRSLSSNGDSWFVAWSGATSSSPAIEQFAECISLPSRTRVQVRVISNMPKATLVTIEPFSEDDWEVLELNAEHAEDAILKQVRVVHKGMRFPLWLHGRTIVTFCVVSTIPARAVVQLMPGAEVAVAPKRRAKKVHKEEDSSMISSQKYSHSHQALLRIQEPDKRLIHKSEVDGIELGIVLTSLAFVHPDTVERFSLDTPGFVFVEPSTAKESNKHPENSTMEKKSNSNGEGVNNGILTDKKEVRGALVCLLTSDSVAKGHLMISQSLRIYLRAGLHSWVNVRRFNNLLNKNIPSGSICPASFRIVGKNEKKGRGVLHKQNRSKKNTKSMHHSALFMDVEDWSTHEEVINVLSHEPNVREVSETADRSSIKKGLQSLLKAWFTAHLDAIASNCQGKIDSFLLGNISLLHFEVKSCDLNFPPKAYFISNASLRNRTKAPSQPVELLYLLSLSDGPILSRRVSAYQIAVDATKEKPHDLGGLDILAEKVDWSEPVSLHSSKERVSNNEITVDFSSLSWMQTSTSDVVNRMMVLLSPASGKWFSMYDLPLPGHIIIHGPPGSGKTLLAGAVARTLENNPEILAHTVFVRCPLFAQDKASVIRHKLSSFLTEALNHAPSVVVFDDLDDIVQSSFESEGSQLSSSTVELTEFLSGILDEYGEKRKLTCGIGPLAFVATVQSLDKIPQSLISSGRFDFHVQLPAPAASEREAMLRHEIQRRSLQCPLEILQDVASKCDGYDAYDLEILVDRAIHSAIARLEPSQSSSQQPEKFSLEKDDFSRAMHGFLPVAMRDITKSTPEGGRSGWDDVGGLSDIRNVIEEMIELPSKFPNVFAKSPLRLRSNVLLYGPPGCGKTHIVGAAAAACSLRFISVKGPELLNKYIGASEQAVRDIFAKATSAAPCLLFFDEFDSIAPKRGHDNTGVTDRVVNQFLTELDGVEVLTGVFVFAATSRPDLLDAALLRPGRLDRLLFCDFPSKQERLDILRVLSRKLPLAEDVDLDAIARMTEGFSGADLQALLSDTQLAAVHDLLDSEDGSNSGKMPIIIDALLKSVAAKARPSVSDTEKDRLYSIYRQFLDAKKSTAAQSRDAKGKRATLA